MYQNLTHSLSRVSFVFFTKFVKIGQRSQRSKEMGLGTFFSFRTLPISLG